MTTATGKRGKNLYKNAYRWTQTKKKKVQYQRSAAVGKSEKIHSGYKWEKKKEKQWTRDSVCRIPKKRGVKISASKR